MAQPARPISQQAGMIVVILATAVLVRVAIAWLQGPRVPSGTGQAPPPMSTPAQLAQSQATTVVMETGVTAPLTTVATLAPPSPTVEATVVPTRTPSAVPTIQPSATATTAPTIQPSATATIAPTIQPSATVAPSPTSTSQETVRALLQQVAAAEAALRSGALDATIDYTQGHRASAQVQFDFGDAQRPPRLAFKSGYEGADAAQTSETITIGNQSWERQGLQSWSVVPTRKGLWDQIQFFLPHVQLGTNHQTSRQSNQIALSWYDAPRDADVTLVIDPDTNVPRELQRRVRSTGLILNVTYTGWNTAVVIQPPAGS